MGTRGFIGFVADERETVTYVHWDSYPDGVGLDVLHFARAVTDWDHVKRQAAAIVHIDPEVPPTDDQRTQLAKWEDSGVGSPDNPWYRLLRRTQGDTAAILECGHALHDPEWPGDSLFCEWGYLIDLDAQVLEIYQGFQEERHMVGRFHERPCRDGYYPVRRVASWPLSQLPDDSAFTRLDR